MEHAYRNKNQISYVSFMDGKKKRFPEDLNENQTLPLQIAYPSNNYVRVNKLVGKHEKLSVFWKIFKDKSPNG